MQEIRVYIIWKKKKKKKAMYIYNKELIWYAIWINYNTKCEGDMLPYKLPLSSNWNQHSIHVLLYLIIIIIIISEWSKAKKKKKVANMENHLDTKPDSLNEVRESVINRNPIQGRNGKRKKKRWNICRPNDFNEICPMLGLWFSLCGLCCTCCACWGRAIMFLFSSLSCWGCLHIIALPRSNILGHIVFMWPTSPHSKHITDFCFF